MMWKNKLIMVFIMSALIFLLFQPSSRAIEVEKCEKCHEVVEPIPSSSILKNCFVCHGNHDSGSPAARDPKTVHKIHEDTIRSASSGRCGSGCHQAPVMCTKCHPSHKSSINDTIINIVQNNTLQNNTLKNKNDTVAQSRNISDCNNCHGKLPQPLGHENFLDALSESKHKWMNCGTCHINVYNRSDPDDYKFKLRFKNLFFVPIDNSSQVCKICHLLQYEGLKEGTHGVKNKKCVDCHSPHTTKLTTGSKLITPKPTPVNISTKVESTTGWITKKVPILGNPLVLFIIFIVILVTVSEYILSRHDEGTKVTYNTVKIAAKEDNLKTLDIRLKDQNINTVGEILEKDGIDILGMTMTKEKDASINIYKYIIFINVERPIEEKDEKELVDKILSIGNVKSASFTDKYDL